MALAEAVVVAALGGIGGVALGLIIARLGLGAGGADVASSWMWITAALLAGVGIVIAAIWLPSRHDARHATVSAARADVGRRSRPLPMRLGLDLIALVVGALIVWASSRGGYAVVLAPEGVPSVSVNYAALVGPLLLWVGLGLGGWRFADALTRRRDLLRRLVRPAGRGLSPVIASNLSRRHEQLARAIALLALSIAFAASTSVFNATYRQQVEVDAALTNGADVTVTELPGSKVAADERSRLAGVPGVSRVDALQHRFAYVGSDLQDLYGVEPGTIADAVHLQDAYVAGGTVRSLMRELERRPDGVLVSAETVHDFQLRPGDQLRLRLPDARTGALREIDFHYVGIVKEFPTAPSDSFLVANAAYIAERTGDASVGTWLLDTDAAPPVAVARRVRAAVGAGATVTDIETSRRIVGSSLTAVDLRGLTRVELGFALALAAGSAGLVLTLGLAERRRTFALIRALGGRRDQLAAFIRAEALATTAAGLLLGIVGGWALATVLVKVLTGVFDPPPSHLAVPWAYLAVTLSCVVGSVVATTEIVHRAVARPAVEQLRDL
jgi:putative ABC transport system permease protein